MRRRTMNGTCLIFCSESEFASSLVTICDNSLLRKDIFLVNPPYTHQEQGTETEHFNHPSNGGSHEKAHYDNSISNRDVLRSDNGTGSHAFIQFQSRQRSSELYYGSEIRERRVDDIIHDAGCKNQKFGAASKLTVWRSICWNCHHIFMDVAQRVVLLKSIKPFPFEMNQSLTQTDNVVQCLSAGS